MANSRLNEKNALRRPDEAQQLGSYLRTHACSYQNLLDHPVTGESLGFDDSHTYTYGDLADMMVRADYIRAYWTNKLGMTEDQVFLKRAIDREDGEKALVFAAWFRRGANSILATESTSVEDLLVDRRNQQVRRSGLDRLGQASAIVDGIMSQRTAGSNTLLQHR